MAQQAKTADQVRKILAKVKYKDWSLRVIEKHEDTILCQWIFKAPDNDKPGSTELEDQFCRKWYISAYSTRSEIIRTAYKAVVAAEMHEIDENFTYGGVRVFDPHSDLVQLANFTKLRGKQDVREPLVKDTPMPEGYVEAQDVIDAYQLVDNLEKSLPSVDKY